MPGMVARRGDEFNGKRHLLVGAIGGKGGCLDQLPDLRDQKTSEEGLRCRTGEARAREEPAPWRNSTRPEAREHAECGIKTGDECAGEGGSRAAAGGNLEFRDDPARAGRQVGTQPQDEGFGLRFGQTVEKEMGGDEIVIAGSMA